MTYVVFSDIDGTLIDFQTYSMAETKTAVSQLVAAHIPLVLCSSKTRAEQHDYRHKLRIPDPFIVENGSAIFIPHGYFPFEIAYQKTVSDYNILELGVGVDQIRAALSAVRAETGVAFQSYADLSIDEVSRITGLDVSAAARAQNREYSETILTPLTPSMKQTLRGALAAYDLALVSGGKFYTIMSAQCDKGTAVSYLTRLFRHQSGDITTIGLGDSKNDAPMLTAVDHPYLVQKPGGIWQNLDNAAVHRVAAVGPIGWRQVIETLLTKGINDSNTHRTD